MRSRFNTRLVVAVSASLYFLYYACTYTDWHFIDNVNLIIHEAGHVIFLPFGEFLHILGGSLLQVLFPFVFAFYFYKRREYFSASLVLFWVGQNIINVSVYVSDSIVMQLSLLGGDSVGHDWNNLLSMIGFLKYTDSIGNIFFGIGIFILVCAMCFSITYSFTD